MLVIPNGGEEFLLKLILSATRQTKLYINLFSNNPDLSSGDFTINNFLVGNQLADDVMVYNGYVAKYLNPENCSFSTDQFGVTTAQYDPIVFSFENGLVPKIYGYFISALPQPAFDYVEPYSVEVPSSPLMAEKFDSPFSIPTEGSTITVVPKIRLSSL